MLCGIGLGSAHFVWIPVQGFLSFGEEAGKLVAESLGGKRISPSSAKGDERKLMNIVEEMAIASGVPVPPVFLMDEDRINAFAAGYSPKDAVLGVTRGCISKLNRSELQGVIAHEFSHILNGDMRMNIKLIGILHGILLIGLTGHVILRNLFYFGGGSRSRRSNKDNNGGGAIIVIAALAVAAIIIGFIGVFFGNLIRAAVSRQREFLADASAVQFTRDPGESLELFKESEATPVARGWKTRMFRKPAICSSRRRFIRDWMGYWQHTRRWTCEFGRSIQIGTESSHLSPKQPARDTPAYRPRRVSPPDLPAPPQRHLQHRPHPLKLKHLTPLKQHLMNLFIKAWTR